ncbi:glycoside hydrolase family 27 protein [Edaphobacter modestus]|uniref:Alpha-galactosidase n=1 Tax=Edaphobacter modestus TaxID=388466 RepID=A0A4Q7YUX2_9BACT|nr:glycoside hydrolase family 27 protein [Edaphobacter modestus]RZU41587.1 alpha galactosidase A [Edaphobacter modestus]
MLKRYGVITAITAGLLASSCSVAQERLASTPPMGWNSWDSYGLTINEAQFRANADVLAKRLKAAGYEYAVVDEGWYLLNPQKPKADAFAYRMDANGRYEPALNRFASAAGSAGFKPVSSYVHGLGLKFGIHIIRGIPKKAVEQNTPVTGSAFRAAEVADTADTCPWNPDNFGVKDNAAGQAWYDSLMRQYADWGVDYLKVDCIASHPYKGDEIRMIHRAIAKTGRAMVLSLSPGPAPLDKFAEVAANAQLWRISDDVWDRWERPESERFPQGVKNQFAVLASWVPHVKPGNWPDADMLPLGTLGPVPGHGDPRRTRLTQDEQRTMMTLWAIARSPLFLGANLTELDDWTASLLTNADVVAMDQRGGEQRLAGQDRDLIAWTTKVDGEREYLALFNAGDSPVAVMTKPWLAYGLLKKSYKVRDVWAQKSLGAVEGGLKGVMIAPHGVLLLELRP